MGWPVMRGGLVTLLMFPVLGCVAAAEQSPFAVQGWFGLEMFADMNCANNPVWVEVTPGSNRLGLRWRIRISSSTPGTR